MQLAYRILWVFGLSLALLPSARAQGNLSQRIAVEEAMRRANDHYQSTFYPGDPVFGGSVWNVGAYETGNIRAWQTLGIQAYHDYAVTWATANTWTAAAFADDETCGQTYIDLYRVVPQPVRIASITSVLDSLLNTAANDDWYWIDAFYMSGPAFAKLGVTKSNPAYFGQMSQMYLYMKNTRHLFSTTHGLWYRDDEARIKTGANTPEFWGRGNGWVIAACARVLEELPAGDSRRPEFIGMLQTMAAALLPLQGVDGFWRSNLKFPNHYSNPETSCTAFFTYAMAYGINAGLLDSATYSPVVLKAWNGMNTLALDPGGKLGYVQAIGRAPNPATVDSDKDYGYGAFLLAGSEILRLLGGPAPVSADAGPDVTLTDTNGDQVEPVLLNASASVIRSGGITRYSWWLGATYLGEGQQLAVDFPGGTHAVTLKAEHSGGTIFTDTKLIAITTATSLPDTNGLPDPWEIHHFAAAGQNPAADPNGDGVTLLNDFILGNDPLGQNPNPLRITRNPAGQVLLGLDARAAFGPGYTGKTRKFRILSSTTLQAGDWQVLPGYESVTGDNLPRDIAIPPGDPRRFYQARVWLE